MQISKDTEDFIAHYKAALKAKLSREEFAEYLGVKSESVIRRRLSVYHHTGLNLPYLDSDPNFDGISVDKADNFESALESIKSKHKEKPFIIETDKQKVYIIVSAQNATPVHDGFWATILMYAELRNAEIIVIPYRYHNPTSIWSETAAKEDYWWSSLAPYINSHNRKLCDGLQVLGHIKMKPTAVNPLSGLDGYTGLDSAVVGHPKVQLRTVATPSKKMPKILTTTGSCTVPNYTDSKTGHKGKFHHNLSALVVEVDNDCYHMRHVHGEDNGNFYDLEYYYTPYGREKYGRAAGLVPGDIHAEFIDEQVEAATFKGPESIVETLRPEVMALHDVEDFYRRNHHHRGNDLLAFGKHHFGRNNVEDGLQVTADFIDRYSRNDMLTLIIRSNHDEAFERWLREADPKSDPENAKFYYYMKFHQLDKLRPTSTGFDTINAFKFWCENPMDQRGLRKLDNIKFMKRDESFIVSDIEIGFHGDIGSNGSRGSIKNYTKIGPKVVIGHTHSPGIDEGAYQVGVSASLNLEYANGPSGWLHTHCLIYPNGSRTLINVINGKWRASF